MLLRPDVSDARIIALGTTRVLGAVGAAMIVPAVLGFARGETNDALSFVFAAGLGLTLLAAGEARLRSDADATWQHGMVTAALSWLAAAWLGSLPLYLSGHYSGYLDAYFDAMSGFATAGLAVINDLDHVSDAINLWRHLMQFLGGQGLIVLVLSVFAGGGGAVGMYVGEARTDRILPNVVRTARFIWRVSLFWFVVGGTALWAAIVAAGAPPGRALFHAVTLFMAAFDTGGFAPTTAGIGLYHSAPLELVLGVVMIAGALSFALHFQLWQGRLRELLRNDELRLFFVSMIVLFALVGIGLLRVDAYTDPAALLRRGFFHVVSAHTGTGFASIPSPLFLTWWGALAPAAIVVAMGLGAMAGSTAGGIKLIRVDLVARAVRLQVRRMLLPPSAAAIDTYHSGVRQILRSDVVRAALTILLLYLALYLLGALAGLFYGYSFEVAMFESTSAAAAVGLSVGITGPTLEAGLKIVYILEMWIGRLEFVAVFALAGFIWSTLRGRT